MIMALAQWSNSASFSSDRNNFTFSVRAAAKLLPFLLLIRDDD